MQVHHYVDGGEKQFTYKAARRLMPLIRTSATVDISSVGPWYKTRLLCVSYFVRNFCLVKSFWSFCSLINTTLPSDNTCNNCILRVAEKNVSAHLHTRLHSSRMRTARSLNRISQHALHRGDAWSWGGACSQEVRGACSQGVGGA